MDLAMRTSGLLTPGGPRRMTDEGAGIPVTNEKKVGLDLFAPRNNLVIGLAQEIIGNIHTPTTVALHSVVKDRSLTT